MYTCMEERITVDVVIPSIRLDAIGMLETLGMDVPAGMDVRYYIVSDNSGLKPGRHSYDDSPVDVIVNDENLGAPLSRNVGMEAGDGKYVLFIDDDVDVPPGILGAYLKAIREHPEAPGYVGPTIFPEPVNSFTRGIVASGMLTFFKLPTDGNRLMSWGTTSNIMLRRDVVSNVRFSKTFPRHGGGEDIDFCIRVATSSGRLFRTVPGAAVQHPWWGNGRRSYVRFFRWAFGDSALVRMHPKYAYYDVPDIVETLVLVGSTLACLSATGVIVPAAAGIWTLLAVCSEFAIEQFQVRSHHPKSSVLAGLEAGAIRISSQMGRFFGPLSRREMFCICRRFDYITTGEWKSKERAFTRAKFALFALSIPAAYWLGLLWSW